MSGSATLIVLVGVIARGQLVVRQGCLVEASRHITLVLEVRQLCRKVGEWSLSLLSVLGDFHSQHMRTANSSGTISWIRSYPTSALEYESIIFEMSCIGLYILLM